MPTADYYLNYLGVGVEVLEDYLLSRALFWPLEISSPLGEPSYPRLTLGNLLLYRSLIVAIDISLRTSRRMKFIENEINKCYMTRRVAWVRKANHEYKSRLRQWNNYISELFQKPDNHIDFYCTEVRSRLILDLLKTEVENLNEGLFHQLQELDLVLEGVLNFHEFIWDKEIQSGFNRDSYWYLWGKPSIHKFVSR